MQETIENYEILRKRCYDLAKSNDGKLMGNDSWLRAALSESDITLSYFGSGINCYGSTFTCQTQDNEWFDFTIPFELLVD